MYRILHILSWGIFALVTASPSSALAQACQITAIHDKWAVKADPNVVIPFGDLKIRVVQIGPDNAWVVIDLKIPNAEPTLGVRLEKDRALKLTACGSETTITFDDSFAWGLDGSGAAGRTIRVSTF